MPSSRFCFMYSSMGTVVTVSEMKLLEPFLLTITNGEIADMGEMVLTLRISFLRRRCARVSLLIKCTFLGHAEFHTEELYHKKRQ